MDKSRRMLYPVTFTAKVLQFPIKYYFNNSPYFQAWVYSVLICIPIAYKVQQLSFSPALVEKREKRLQNEYKEYLEHQKHLL